VLALGFGLGASGFALWGLRFALAVWGLRESLRPLAPTLPAVLPSSSLGFRIYFIFFFWPARARFDQRRAPARNRRSWRLF